MYNLLIADDEVQSRDTLASCFPWDMVGFRVTGQASDGREALEFLKTHTVHAVLCDIRMPVMDGIELARTLYENGKDDMPAIIFLSGYRDFSYAQQALKYNVYSYIVKPARYHELSETFTALKAGIDRKMADRKDGSGAEPPGDPVTERITAYIQQNYRTATLTEAAELLRMNASYVSQLFKEKTGCNFSDYLMEVRMKKAAELLKSPDTMVYDVSNQVGYISPKNFARAFRGYFGKTPKEYREAHRE